MANFTLFDIFRIDDDMKDKSARVNKGIFSLEFSGSVTQQMKRMLSGRIFKLGKAVSYILSHISTKAYGSALLSFGLLSILMYFVGISKDESLATPIIGTVLSLLAVPFLLGDKPLPIFLQDFALTDYIFFEFFCMKRHTAIEKESRFPLLAAVIIGFLPAMLSALLPLWQITVAIAVIVFVYVSMESPEFAFFLSLFALPYFRYIPNSAVCLGALVLLATVSFVRKILYGKRVIFVEPYEVFLGAMLLFVLISGIFVKGIESFSGSVEMIVLALGYILAGNLITNRRLAERAVNSIVISAALAALISVVQLIMILVGSGGSPGNDEISHLLAREDGIAVLMLTAIVFAVGMIRQSGRLSRAAYITAVGLCLAALIICGELASLLALIASIGVFAVIKSNKLVAVIVPALLVMPLTILLLPNDFLNSLMTVSPSLSTAESLFELWGNSLGLFVNNMLVGIGIGADSFAAEMSEKGMFGYADSSNLFIELGLEAGVFALMCFICMLIIRLKHRSDHYIYVRNSPVETLCCVSGACLFCLLSFGMFNYIWSDIAAYYMFWCIFGIGSATLRVAKKDYDDRVLYYEETSAVDASVIDVMVV